MRVGTWNVHGFRGYGAAASRHDLTDPRGWARVLGGLGCELLAIQEAGGDAAFLRSVAAALGRHLVELPSRMRWPIALLCASRPEARVAWSGARSEPFSRAAGAVRVDPGDGEALWTVAIHAHPSDASLRHREADRLGAELDAMGAERERVVVLGDFNSAPGAALHRVLRDRGFTHVLGDGAMPRTRHQRRSAFAVDHVYLSPRLRTALRGARVVTDPGYGWTGGGPSDALPASGAGTGVGWSWSDHLPVVADLALGGGPSRSA